MRLVTDFKLAVDIRGQTGLPILFLHGGPGQGASMFMDIQGDRLASRHRIVGLYQRGVPPSAEIPAGGTVSIDDLVADCERVRVELRVERWAVLGHSFGGALALRYVAAAPDHVSAVIFENPVWSTELSARAALPRLADLLRTAGQPLAADRAEWAAGTPMPPASSWAEYVDALQSLGERRDEFFAPMESTRSLLHANDVDDPDADRQAMRHHLAITSDPALHDSLLSLLPDIQCPALLITGEQDPLTSADQRQAFTDSSPANVLSCLDRAGHFAHADEPDRYHDTVIDFLEWP
jgi:proline iminopeptidase